MPVSKENFGALDNGQKVQKFTLSNENGVIVELIDYGATIVSVKVPNTEKPGSKIDLVLGYDNIDGYLGKPSKNPYFGAIVGRVANRIAEGTFKIDGEKFTLAQNNGTNSLHGGLIGYDKVIWNSATNENSVTFSYLSKDGEEGYPGDVVINVTYTLTRDNGLKIDIKGVTSKATPLNLANHVYFNLAGHETGAKGLGEHFVAVNADHYLPTSDKQIPLGNLEDVGGSVFDLRIPRKLSEMLPNCPGGENNGYDHNFCVNGKTDLFRLACRAEHRESKRALECYSNQPGVQFYTGNFIPADNSLKGKNGSFYGKHGGFCLETQTFPDAINQSFDHDSILRPGQVYDHQVMYKFFF